MFFGRGRNKIQGCYTMPDMYNFYKENVDEGSPYDIPYSTYVKIVSSYNKKIIQRLYDGFIVTLPYRLGTVQIIKKKMYFASQINKKRGINWGDTNKYGKVIHHLNEHSDGYKYLFYWNKKGGPTNIKGYRYIPTRTMKRTLAKLIKVHKKDYFEAN